MANLPAIGVAPKKLIIDFLLLSEPVFHPYRIEYLFYPFCFVFLFLAFSSLPVPFRVYEIDILILPICYLLNRIYDPGNAFHTARLFAFNQIRGDSCGTRLFYG
jgi:hypothetical protein